MLQTPRCYHRRCKHFQGVRQTDGTEQTEVPVCAAFPAGIPVEIAYGNSLHLKPFQGDHGIRYERQETPVHNAEIEGIRLGPAVPTWHRPVLPSVNEQPAIHKRLFARYGRYVVYLVDGEKVRNSSKQMEAFTDWAIRGTEPSELPEIPKEEVWVEDTLDPQERHIAVSCALCYLETGSYDAAMKVGWRERELLDGKTQPGQHAGYLPKKLYKQGPLTTPIGNPVYLVDGDVVRDHFKPDFVLGGNGEAYRWVPQDEIWIEQDVKPDERIYILIHELIEWWLMTTEGLPYAKAHEIAEQVEYKWRHSGGRPAVDAMTAKWVQHQVVGVM